MGCEYENTKRKQLNINRVTQQKGALWRYWIAEQKSGHEQGKSEKKTERLLS